MRFGPVPKGPLSSGLSVLDREDPPGIGPTGHAQPRQVDPHRQPGDQDLGVARPAEGGEEQARAGADAVKVEGGDQEICRTVGALKAAGISVMGHLGLTPQRAGELGGYKVQGKTEEDALRMIEDARRLEEAGIFSLVLECVPRRLAKEITGKVNIPTIGIGAGPDCDGQVLVLYDLLGLQDQVKPRFVRVYSESGKIMREAVQAFCRDVSQGDYPSKEESFD